MVYVVQLKIAIQVYRNVVHINQYNSIILLIKFETRFTINQLDKTNRFSLYSSAIPNKMAMLPKQS